MQRTSIVKYLVGCLGVSVAVGCAVGADPDLTGTADLKSEPIEAGDENSVQLPGPSQPDEQDAGAGGDDAGGGSDSGGGKDSGGGGTDGGSDAGGGGTSCASPNTCLGATDLGAVSGDTGADVQTAQGSGSQWFKVRVGENDSSVFGAKLSVRADLNSPPGTNFDVFVYVPGGSSGQECSAVSASSTNASGADSARSEWGEGSISNGSDDSRTVSIEVRWVSGTCSASSKWSLSVRGNAP